MDSTNSTDRYSLRWNNYNNNISQLFDEHLRKEALVDVTLSCEGEFIKAHKLILSACSDYFRDLFNKHSMSQHPIIVFHSVKAENLKNLLEFMYHGEIKVLESEIEGLLLLGESLHVKGLCSVKFRKPQESAVTVPVPPSDSNLPKPVEVSEGITPPPLITFTKKDMPVGDTAVQNPGDTQVQPVLDSVASSKGDSVLPTSNSDKTATGIDISKLLLRHQLPMASPQVPVVSAKMKHFTKPNILARQGGNVSKDKVKTYSKIDKTSGKTRRLSTGVRSPTGKEGSPVRTTSSPQPSSERNSSGTFTQTIKVRDFGIDLNSTESKRRRTEKDRPSGIVGPESTEPLSKFKVLSTVQSSRNSASPMSDSDSRERNSSNRTEKPADPLKAVVDGGGVPRPPNAFMIFANEWRKKLSIEHPKENSKEVNYRLGNMWKAMSIETKNIYYQAAQKAADEYKQKVAESEGGTQGAGHGSNSSKPGQVVHAVQLLKLVMNNPEPPTENLENENIIYIKEEPDDTYTANSSTSNQLGH